MFGEAFFNLCMLGGIVAVSLLAFTMLGIALGMIKV